MEAISRRLPFIARWRAPRRRQADVGREHGVLVRQLAQHARHVLRVQAPPRPA